jgi:CRP/FNR family transcriptional regulator, anaerobic regulatory protein
MLSINSSIHTKSRATHERVSPAIHRLPGEAKLCSHLSEIGDFLHIQISDELSDEYDSFQHINYKAGQHVYFLGQPFESLYLVNSGFLKSVLYDDFGNEQVLNFPMQGDVLAIDSMHTNCHNSEAIALDDCNIIKLPYRRLLTLSQHCAQFEQAIFGFFGKAVESQQTRLSILGKSKAEARVVQFLLLLSNRFLSLGYSGSEFNLRMSRYEIGSYLGLTLETVSRVLSSLNESGVISVHQKKVYIHDFDALYSLQSSSQCSH